MKVKAREQRPDERFIRRVNEIVSSEAVLPELLETIEDLRDTIRSKDEYITRLESEIAKYRAELQAGVLIEPRQIVTTTRVVYDYRGR